MMSRSTLRYLGICCAAAVLAFLPLSGTVHADSTTGVLQPVDGAAGDGTMSAVARRAMTHGALPASDADVALKAAANAASSRALRGGSSAAEGQAGPLAPVIAQNIAGQFDAGASPPDTFGATGTTRYIQTVNRRVGIYSRTGILINAGTLDNLFGATASNFDPQIIWDPTTNRFYYAGDAVFSSADNRIAFGFSKSSSPNNSTVDFCHYFVSYGAKFPDYPKLGDNEFFGLIGVNNFQPGFVGSDVVAIRKPVGTGIISTCPSLGFKIFANLRDSTGALVFTPTPANSIDTNGFGYVIARNLFLPSTKIWDFPITAGSLFTLPSILVARVVNVASYTAPADAVQPNFTQKLDTLDARLWQAVLARNPQRGNALSLWTQHTVSDGLASDIRFYEIKPDQSPTILQRSGTIGTGSSTFFFNGAVSSDRRLALPATTGDDMVIGYNVSSTILSARIVVGSSVAGAPLQFQLVQNGLGPYRDFTCASAGQTCRWGDYASATPDPLPQGGFASAVGFTHQFSVGGVMPTTQSNWTTRIYHVRP